MLWKLEKFFLEKDSGDILEKDLEQALGTVLTKAIHFGLSAGISRKFLRDAHEHVINSGCTARISRKFLREDTSSESIDYTHSPESRENFCERTWRESVYTPPLVRHACLLDCLIMFLRDEERLSYRRSCLAG